MRYIVTKDGQNPNKCTATKLPYVSTSQPSASVHPCWLDIRESTTVNQPALLHRSLFTKKAQSTTDQFQFGMWSTKQLSIHNMQCLEGVPVYMYVCVVRRHSEMEVLLTIAWRRPI